MIIVMEFREFLRIERVRRNISQAELAARLTEYGEETSAARVGHWETGRNIPPMHEAQFRSALARALQMSVLELLIRLGYVVPQDQQSDAARRAGELIEALPEEAKETALEMLEVLARRYGNTNG